MQASVLRQESLHQFALMDRMVIPHQHNRSANASHQGHQKGDHFFATQGATMRADHQFQPTTFRRHQYGPQQVQPFVMIQTGAHPGRLAAWRPSPFEWRNQRKTALIFDHQRRVQVTPLFLSAARRSAASALPPDHRDQTDGVAVADNSSRAAARCARRHWDGNGHQTAARLHGQSGRASSNLQHNRAHKRRVSRLAPVVATGGSSTAGGGQAVDAAWATERLVANVVLYVPLRLIARRSGPSIYPPVKVSTRVDDGLLTDQMFLWLSCHQLWHRSGHSFFKIQ
jgi:hypothetical protein